jgi:uncharacterized membrane protein YfcA
MILEAFREGGWGMFPTAIFGILLVGVAVRYAIDPAKRLVPLLVSLGAVTLTAGALGFVTGFIKSVSAIEASPEHNPALALLGAGEAANCVGLALCLMTIAGLATSAGALRIAARQD